MTNLLKRVNHVNSRIPKVPQFATDEKLADKIKKMAKYWSKAIEIDDSDLIKASEQFHLTVQEGMDVREYQDLKDSDKKLVSYFQEKYHNQKVEIPTRYLYSRFDSSLMICFLNNLPISQAGDKYISKMNDGRCLRIFPTAFIATLTHIVGKSNHKSTLSSFMVRGIEYKKDDVLEDLLNGDFYSKKYSCFLQRDEYMVFSKTLDRIANVEENMYLNKVFESGSAKKIATVREDKKYKDIELNKNSIFNTLGFRKLEVDTENYEGQQFDYHSFNNIEKAWKDIYKSIPKTVNSPELKFRKLGKHKAAGLYIPSPNIMCVDVRHTSSFVHEYGHYLDYQDRVDGSQWSLDDSFSNIIEIYKDQLPQDVGGGGKYNRDYYCTPTEIFARGFELWVSRNIVSDSPLLKSKETYQTLPEYVAFEAMIDQVLSFYSEIFKNSIHIHSGNRVTENDYIQLSLFDEAV